MQVVVGFEESELEGVVVVMDVVGVARVKVSREREVVRKRITDEEVVDFIFKTENLRCLVFVEIGE